MSGQAFQIKIKSMDNSQFDVTVTENMLISELKSLISAQVQIPVDRQRLLYERNLLINTRSLRDYSIVPTSILQILAYLERPPEEDSLSEVIRYAIESIPNSYISNRRARDHRRREIDINEKIESIRQNLLTLENIITNNRNFHKGQWVDVKDTVDQWLEAQITDIRQASTETQVYVHYNGWPSRWDEWIDINSPRIQYFKTRTYQSLASPMHSPYPVNMTDSEDLRSLGPFDLNECLLQTLGILEQTQVMLNLYNDPSHQNSQESRNTAGLLAPLMDRIGRLLCDLGGIIGNTQRPNDETGSVSSSLITNESGISSNSGVRPPMQIPVMPPPAELALMTPRIGPDFDIHIHAFFGQRNLEQEPRGPCWENLT
jgi:Ubiquitin family/RNA binding activity-knot of a chromodomain